MVKMVKTISECQVCFLVIYERGERVKLARTDAGGRRNAYRLPKGENGEIKRMAGMNGGGG